MRHKGQTEAEYIMPYCKAIVDNQIERNETKIILDISEVAYKFLSSFKDVTQSVELLKELGYCFINLGNFEYLFVGMRGEEIAARKQAALLKRSIFNTYREDLNRLICCVDDGDLFKELVLLRKILNH